jgi:Zn-dependent metalloprotease
MRNKPALLGAAIVAAIAAMSVQTSISSNDLFARAAMPAQGGSADPAAMAQIAPQAAGLTAAIAANRHPQGDLVAFTRSGAAADATPEARRARALIDNGAARDAHRAQADAFAARDVIVDRDGTEHVRMDRTYQGMPVIGGDVVVHSRNGQVLGVSGTLRTDTRPSLDAKVNADSAMVIAGADFGGNIDAVSSNGMVVYARGEQPVLAHEIRVLGKSAEQGDADMRYFIDAANGQVLDRWNTVYTAAAAGTGNTLYLGNIGITTDSTATGFQMVDPSRGSGSTYDARNVAYTSAASGATIFTDADNIWGNNLKTDRATAATDAHYGVAATWDYYRNVHSRSGIFNDGRGVKSYVHTGSNWNNAAWYANAMYYGDGDGTSWNPLVVLDVAGHEMSHGVTQATANLAYSRDAGGLNEGTSDIMGTMVEYFINNAADTPDYLIGEKIYISNPTGTKALRVMFKQNLDGASYVCYPSRGFGTKPADNPHYTSGVANRFFYLLAEGAVVPAGFGAGTTYNLTPASLVCNGNTAITGIGRSAAEKIWYRALSVYMTSTTTYPGARTATLNAAKDLYGLGSAQYNAVAAAWSAVSVN